MKNHLIHRNPGALFICKVCSATYKQKEVFKIHLLEHDNLYRFRCNHCNYFGNVVGDFKKHILTHSVNKPLKCSVCSYRCIHPWRLRTHLQIHSQDKPLLKCDICDFTCLSAPRLKDHKASHSQEGVIKCEFCNYVCTQPSRMKRHIKTHTLQKTYTGTTFPPAYQQKMELVEKTEADGEQSQQQQQTAYVTCQANQTAYMTSQANQTTYVSIPANQPLDMETDWGPEHMDEEQFQAFAGKEVGETYTTTTSDGGQTYISQTEVAPDKLASKSVPMNKPSKSHVKLKKFQCDQCDFCCDYQSTLAVHMSRHLSVDIDTSTRNIEMFTCQLCGFCCKSKVGLKDHMKIHTLEKAYTCQECDYSCRSAEGLKSHMFKHYGVKPYTCDICGQGCSSAYLLKKHKFIHGETPLQCQFCDYKCIQKKQLTNHLLQHKYQHPFCCTFCTAIYKKEESFKIHMMSHQNSDTGNCPTDVRRHPLNNSTSMLLQCPHCSYLCIHQSRLKAHIASRHSEEGTAHTNHPADATSPADIDSPLMES